MGVYDFDWDSYNGYYSGEESVGSINTMSICKSELLFSPVKEAAHGVHFSVDSLDCELPTEQDLILTCQANKDNYTIAFEGSLTTYSEDSECIDPPVNQTDDNLDKDEDIIVLDNDERTRRNLELLKRCKKLTNKLTTSMARSDLGLTTWSKLKKQTSQSQLKRHPSGNNNEECNETADAATEMANSVIKSQSLPNLYRRKLMNSSINSTALSNSTVDSFTTNQRLTGTSACMKVYDVTQNQCISRSSQHSEPMSTSSTENQTSCDKSQPKQPFNLVKLFMKQKSMSNEGIVGMDQLERSECWPSSSGGESGDSMGEQKFIETKILPETQNGIDQVTIHTDDAEKTTEDLIYEELPAINIYSRVCDTILIEEEEETSEELRKGENKTVALSESESNLYATVNKSHLKRASINGNPTQSPSRLRCNRKSTSSQSSATSASISSCSESDGTQITRLNKCMHRDLDNKATSTHLQAETIDKSMQTSNLAISNIPHEKDSLIKIVEPSFLEKLKEGDCEKPVFVLYPNYTLPDISFLNGRPNIYLNPLKINVSAKPSEAKKKQAKGKRPFSCNDVEALKKKGLSHIKDWDSLNFLLPTECKQLLSEVPEIMDQLREKENATKCNEKYCNATPSVNKAKGRPVSCDCNNLATHNTAVSSSSSTATQPSSGYRGSSTMLTDSSAQNSPAPAGNYNPLFVYRYDSATSSEASCANNERNAAISRKTLSLAEQNRFAKQGDVVPPRPPLPKSILRKSIDKVRKSSSHTKRYSMFEMDDLLSQDPIVCMTVAPEHKTKRRSLQEPYYTSNQNIDYRKNNDIAAKRLSQQFLDAADKDAEYNEYYQDEGVGTESSLESGKSNEIKFHRPHTPPLPKPRTKKMEYAEFPPPGALISSADLQQLEEFLKQSGFSCQNMDEWDQNQVQKVRNQVNKFLQMKMSQEENQKSTDSSASSSNSKKSVSFAQKPDPKVGGQLSTMVDEIKEALATPPNSPNISVVMAQRHYQGKNLAAIPICEEAEISPDEFGSPVRVESREKYDLIDISQKRALVSNVTDAVEMLIQHFSPATDQAELAFLGDSRQSPACAKLALNSLCPALYAIFRDGLKESIETSFGAVNNSVWQMVEATARQGPITKSLNELVLRINSEDAVTEGLVKFNAFILGLLNAQSVDAWVSYVRTRESVLAKHYGPDSLILAGCVGEPRCRALLDALLASLEPLRLLPFTLDLMFEMRELHRSFKRIENEMRAASRPTSINTPPLTLNQRNLLKLVRSMHSSGLSSDDCQTSVIMRHKDQPRNKEPSTPDLLNDSANNRTTLDKHRPRSCVNPMALAHDLCPSNSRIDLEQNRRWSGVQLGSKLMQAFDRLVFDESDDYSDSLENNKPTKKIITDAKLDSSGEEQWRPGSAASGGGSAGPTGKFRRLQLKWELLSNAESTPHTPSGETSPAAARGSKIPRPVSSPVRPQAPALNSPAKNTPRGIPVPVRKGNSPTTPRVPSATGARAPSAAAKRSTPPANRTSRVDQAWGGGGAPRPSSLPYGRSPAPAAPRRAASSSAARASNAKSPKPKYVRTLWHRLPSDSGHLAFNEGERLRLILEVDDQYLLCCRGEIKGLVPRDAVLPEQF
ncbi:Iporin [Eumeta japonica]|uniref:Iporin n=1 Tax=Eumeta variegata TaxID=151549 RepID=A0A4C1UHX0_EUMVA|nr:Iporin [Eumeta japonica]